MIFSLPVIDAALGLQEYPQRDLPRQHLDRAPLSDDAAPALAGGGEDAGHGRQLCDAAVALAYRSEFRRRMLSEWDKIEPYKAKGFIAEWPVVSGSSACGAPALP